MRAPIFAPRAQHELRAAAMWIAEDNPAAAEALLIAAMAATHRLQARPKRGRVKLELAPARYRFWSLRGFPYLLVYDAEAEPRSSCVSCISPAIFRQRSTYRPDAPAPG